MVTRRPELRLGLLILGVTCVRLLAAGLIPLTEDEAYYRLWAQHLQFGYYDHPPMIAWWIRLGQTLAGDTPLGVRLVPVLAAGLASWGVAGLARTLGADAATGLRAAVWYNVTTVIGVGGILATPDAPATLFWILCLWSLSTVRAYGTGRQWCLAGLAAGLACLSKYSALFLAPGVFLWLLSTPERRGFLKRPWPWITLAIAGTVFSANIVWNAQHDWLTFAKQFGRIAPGRFKPDYLLELLAGQFLLINPLIAIYAGRGGGQALGNRGRVGSADLSLPLLTALPFAAYLVLHSLHDRVQAHWPAPMISSVVILAAVWAAGRKVPRLPIALGLGLSALVMVYAASGLRLPGRTDPLLPLRDWPQFSQSVETLRRAQGAGWIGTESYGTLAQLAFTGAIPVPIVQVIETVRYGDSAAKPDLTQPGLLVDKARRLDMPSLKTCFAVIQPLGTLTRGPEDGKHDDYEVYLVAKPVPTFAASGCPDDLGKNPQD